ncbi:MAG: hypothetical protein CMN98_07490 [Synechococcus sp. NP17]|nr:hypothetical protein [Synechococcus sp. NP17]|tara:strand:+ start:879 stop:1163 length:285 start_codon:yes stop_codon:yes gene_type:complete
MKAFKFLAALPLLFLVISCSREANDTSSKNANIKEVCALYEDNQITKDQALQQLGLADEEGEPGIDGSIDSDELIYDLCDPGAAKDRGDVEDGV